MSSGGQGRASAGRKLVLFTGFAVLATLANLGMQRLVLAWIGTGHGLLPAMAAGTAIGLVLKYLLDKRWIFDDRSTGLVAHGRRFTLYTGMGLVTTLLFWAVEWGFWHFGRSDFWRETGAILGLALGYGLKYLLDRRFVFVPVKKVGAVV